MFRHWLGMAVGDSYWHVSQPLGRCFVPGALEGYFNDLTAKTEWPGVVDEKGLPLLPTSSGAVHFPTVLFQKGLGHWDRWLQSGRRDPHHLNSFLKIVDWAIDSQDEHGGWPLPQLENGMLCPYSAMTQGEAISLLCRAYSLGNRNDCLQAANPAVSLTLRSLSDKGTARYNGEDEDLVLEEFPLEPPRTVLNGWIFSLYGLYDFCLAQSELQTHSALQGTLRSLVRALPSYDAGYWSYYDSAAAIASPFYHRLHIAQLQALACTFPEYSPSFSSMAAQFEGYMLHKSFQIRAVLLKIGQKMQRPPEPL